MSSNPKMVDPLAYLMTWSTYGTWLPGDERGWIAYHQGWHEPNLLREQFAKSRMKDFPLILDQQQRGIIEEQIKTTCVIRGWTLHALNCRTNHIHLVVSAKNTLPEKVRADLKAWTTRTIREKYHLVKSLWSERGSIRLLFNDKSLENAIIYVRDAQDKQV